MCIHHYMNNIGARVVININNYQLLLGICQVFFMHACLPT